ncbi:MAG TPA: class I SAM-dependent methyltransferase [Chlamydiales bacterium]|nr:class I SAM-dependent methyltransferase [Chlamydiales bacterium]
MDFNDSKDTYRAVIEESIRFAGKDHDFFIGVKADFLNSVVKQVLPSIRKPRLLDVGCGHGYIHKRLHNKGFDVTGVDNAGEVIELAKKLNPNVSYMSHDGKTLPLPEESFDIAMAICVMHHVPPVQWKSFLVEMKRVLKPGGMAIIFEHNPYNPLTRLVVSRNRLDDDAVLLSHSRLEELMRVAEYKKTFSRHILFTPFAQPVFRWLDKKLGWCPLGAQYYTVAIK